MGRPIIYLASVAGSGRRMLEALECDGAAALIDQVQVAVGDGYLVEGDAALIEAGEDDNRGGRSDDIARARAIERRLADDETVAFVALRGGAWLTRILGDIDCDVLNRRRRRITLFGFSELTTLINIASAYPQAFCLHDLCPGFIRKGLRDQARRQREEMSEPDADARFRREVTAFFQDVTNILEGRGSNRSITGSLVNGALPVRTRARFVGGNLTVLTTLLGTAYAAAINPTGRWLLLEDVNESLDRIDRRLAHLKLAGFFDRCAGLLIGDFHEQEMDHQETVVHLLRYHLSSVADTPIIITRDVGHVWPLAPLPLNSPVMLDPSDAHAGRRRVGFHVCWPTVAPGA